MRILIYKRTHIGDPDNSGRFGVNDCMGRVRNFCYDAVIGVGGVGYEAQKYGISRKINWVGINPKRVYCSHGYRGNIIEFKYFILLENKGPLLQTLAPTLATKIYGTNGGRFILDSYSKIEKVEAIKVIIWALYVAKNLRYRQPAISKQRRCKTKCHSFIPNIVIGNAETCTLRS